MTCPPKLADLDRTVIEAVPVDRSDGWWTGLVRDRKHGNKKIRLRFERYPPNTSKNRPEHVWRIRPDFWASEREAVKVFKRQGGENPNGVLPVSDFYEVKEELPIREDHSRRISLVRIEKKWGQTSDRLYHWDPEDDSVKQKWTIGKKWNRLSNLATRKLEDHQ